MDDVASWMRSNRFSTQHREEWGAVVCDEPSATSDPTGSHMRWQRFCPDCRLGVWPGNLPGFRGFHEDSFFQNFVELLILWQLRSIRRSVSRLVLQSLVVLLVLSWLDYGNVTLAGLLVRELNRLQSVLNVAARLIFSTSRDDHLTPLLRELCSLRVPECIDFKKVVLVYWCLRSLAPAYLSTELQSVKDLTSRQQRRTFLPSRHRGSLLSWQCLPRHYGTSLESSTCGSYLIDLSTSFLATGQDLTLFTELSWRNSVCTWLGELTADWTFVMTIYVVLPHKSCLFHNNNNNNSKSQPWLPSTSWVTIVPWALRHILLNHESTSLHQFLVTDVWWNYRRWP